MEPHTCNPALARLRQENGEPQANPISKNNKAKQKSLVGRKDDQGPTEEVTEGASGKLTGQERPESRQRLYTNHLGAISPLPNR